MSEKLEPRPNIAQLEDLINRTEEGEIEINPDGSVTRLNVTELLQKNLRLEQDRNEALRQTVKELRERLKQIKELAAKP